MFTQGFLFLNLISGGILYSISVVSELLFVARIILAKLRKEEEIDNLIAFVFFSSNTSNFFSYFMIKCWLELGFSKSSIIITILIVINNLSNLMEIVGFFAIIFRMYKKHRSKLKFYFYTYFCVWFATLYFASLINPNGYFNIFFNPMSLVA